MPREKYPNELAKYRTVAFPVQVDRALVHFAKENTDGNVAEAIRLLVQLSIGRRGGLSGASLSLKDSGYNAGLRQAKQEADVAIANALNELWRRG